MCFGGMDVLGNHAMLFNSSSDLRANHDNGRVTVSRKDGLKGEEKRQFFLTIKFRHSQCFDRITRILFASLRQEPPKNSVPILPTF